MNDVEMHEALVPQGCGRDVSGARGRNAGRGSNLDAGLRCGDDEGRRIRSRRRLHDRWSCGPRSRRRFRKFLEAHYGLAAAGLLEAEVVTADGKIQIANARTNPDLFWALKGGGGSSFGVVSNLTLRVRDLPEFMGGANFKVKAASDDAYRRLIRQFVGFYRDQLFNDHWGEQAHVSPENSLEISMAVHGLNGEQTRKVWKPFLDWVAQSPGDYTVEKPPIIGSIPARGWWDVEWRKEHHQQVFRADSRPGAGANNVWWNGDGGQVGWVIWAFESLWLPASLLADDSQERLADALFRASRHGEVELHLNKGLAGAPAEALAESANTSMNPAVLTAFALAISADGQGPAYPGIAGHEPDLAAGREAARNVGQCMAELRAIAPDGERTSRRVISSNPTGSILTGEAITRAWPR